MRELLILQREHVELIPYLWVAHRGDERAHRVRNLTIAFGFSWPNRIGARHRAGCPCPQSSWIRLECKRAATRGLSGVRKPSRRAQFPVPSEMTYALAPCPSVAKKPRRRVRPGKGQNAPKWPSRSPLCPVTPQHAAASAAGRNNPPRL